MPVSYDTIKVDRTSNRGQSSNGDLVPISARIVTIGHVPRGMKLEISFDTQNKFMPVRRGDRFESCGREPFQGVAFRWRLLELSAALALALPDSQRYANVFAGGDSVRMEATCEDGMDVDAEIDSRIATGASETIVDGTEGYDFVTIIAPAASTLAVRINDAAGDAITIAAGDERTFVLGDGDTVYVTGTAAAVFVVVYPGGYES